MATKAVLDYLQNQNRPYSANDLIQNLPKEVGKTAIQKALDQLVGNGKIIEKIYGKQKVYSVLQTDDDSSASKMNDDIKAIDAKIVALANELREVDTEVGSAVTELKQLEGSLKTDEAIVQSDALTKTVEALRERLSNLKETKVSISDEEKSSIVTEHAKVVKEYRKRKRMCTEIIDSIMEGYPKSKKCLMEEIGIETDDDVGFTLSTSK